MRKLLAILAAILLHLGAVVAGEWLFARDEDKSASLAEVELLAGEVEEEKPRKDEPAEAEERDPEEQAVEAPDEPPPDAEDILRSLDLAPAIGDVGKLDDSSLAAIEDALRGGVGGGGGDFAVETASFLSGGRIGGTGRPGSLADTIDESFDLSEIDQKARPVFRTSPVIPAEMRGKKLAGVVTLIFVVDATGKVLDPKVAQSNHPAFEKPALEAVKRWKFEPGLKGGQRVASKTRVTIRFPAS